MKMNIPEPARKIIDRLNEHGYEAYVVGGCVRDMILKREPGGLGYHHQCQTGAGQGLSLLGHWIQAYSMVL